MANTNLWLLAASATLLYSAGLVIYRLYFHPLAKFPGPKLAAATGWYEAYHDLKSPVGLFMYKLDKLHKIYGPIVRLSPDEVHIKDSSWADTLLTRSTQGTRDKYQPAASQAGTPDGVFGTSLHNTHRRRRAAMNPLFSKSCAVNSEGMIYDKLDLLIKKIDTEIARDGFIEMRTAFMAFTTDVVSEYSLGEPFGLLSDETKAEEWHASIRSLASTIPHARQFGWIIPLSQKIPVRIMKMVSPSMARVAGMHHAMEAQALEAVREHERDERDGVKPASHRNPTDKLVVYREILAHEGLPVHEKRYNRISHEAVTLMAAGSETTTSTLTMAIYHILNNKETVLKRLREEVESVMAKGVARPSIVELEKLPWLTAVIKETLRISTLTARLTRVAPDEILRYKDWVLPAGTPISVTLREISFDPEIFPSPMEFRPERWLPSNPDVERCNRYLVAFGRGSRLCIGINLAHAELYIVLASLFRNREFELIDTDRARDVDFARDFFVGETSASTKGVKMRYVNPSKY